MPAKSWLAWLLGAAPLALLTGAARPGRSAIEVSCEEFVRLGRPAVVRRTAVVAAGGVLTVALCSNPTTGFRWGAPTTGDAGVLELLAHRFEPAVGGAPGAAGREVWSFRALRPGASRVSLEYGRPWEGGEQGEWRLDLDVVVTPG